MKITLNPRFFKTATALVLFLVWVGIGRGAVTFTITPSVVSNTYPGLLSLAITGFTNSAEKVVVQKYLDRNANGVIDSTDLLVQQFNLTVGKNSVFSGITNYNVPGDYGNATNAISALVYFQSLDFIQTVVGRFVYKVTSISNDFSALTNSLLVTNFPYAQAITGTVVSNGTSQTLPGAVVMLFPPPRSGNHSPGNPLGGTVANNSGSYAIQVPVGSYVPVAFYSNYLANYSASPTVAVSNNVTVTTNVTMQVATSSISGRVVDAANNNNGIPGILFPAFSNSGQLASGFTDTNGNFSLKVTSGTWGLGGYDNSLTVHGFVGTNSSLPVAAGSSGLVFAFQKANALFYGHVRDGSGNPLAGLDIGAQDQNNSIYQSDALTDTNGFYVLGVVGGLGSGDPWSVSQSGESSIYILASTNVDNSGTNILIGQAVLADFLGLPATNYITGNVQFQGTNVIGVGVNANANIGAYNFSLNTVDTDTNGNYSVAVGNGSWSLNLNCNGGNDSLANILSGQNYVCPNSDVVNITNNNGVANFNTTSNTLSCTNVQILTGSLPIGTNGFYYDFILQGSTCTSTQSWSLFDPLDFPNSLNLSSSGEIYGTANNLGTYNFTVQLSDGAGNSSTQMLSLVISTNTAPLQIPPSPLPGATNGVYYNQSLFASGGTPPYTWTIPGYSQMLPANLLLSSSGQISGTPASSYGPHYFDVVVTDAANNTQELDGLSINIVNPGLAPLLITNVSLPYALAGTPYNCQLGAMGGQSPYFWSLVLGSANPPAGLTLSSGGLLYGNPGANTSGSFKVQVTDLYANVTSKVLTVNVVSQPVLGSVKWKPGQFGLFLTGQSNLNYTIQTTTNLNPANWITLFVTNNPVTNAYVVKDPNATNSTRYYRAVVGP